MNPGTESGQTDGAGTAPQTQASQSGDQQSSSTNVSLEAVLRRVDDLQAQVRGLQKVKDKGTNRLQKQVQSVAEQVSKVQKYIERYGSPEEAARQIALDSLLGGDDDDDEPDVPAAKGTAKPRLQASADAQVDHELLDLIGVSANDPELVQRIQEGESYLTAAKAIAKARKSPQSQQPVSAASLAPGGAGSKVETTQAALRASYDAEVAKLPRPTPAFMLEEIKRKYRRQGLDVW